MNHVQGFPESKELQAEMKLQSKRSPSLRCLADTLTCRPWSGHLWFDLMIYEHSESAQTEIWGTLSHSCPIHTCRLPGEPSDEGCPSLWVVCVSLRLLLSGGYALSPGLDGIAISSIPSVAEHEQKWEGPLNQVPAGKTVELTNYTHHPGLSSEMVG